MAMIDPDGGKGVKEEQGKVHSRSGFTSKTNV